MRTKGADNVGAAKGQVGWHGESLSHEGEQSGLKKTQRGNGKEEERAGMRGLSKTRAGARFLHREPSCTGVEARLNQGDLQLARDSPVRVSGRNS